MGLCERISPLERGHHQLLCFILLLLLFFLPVVSFSGVPILLTHANPFSVEVARVSNNLHQPEAPAVFSEHRQPNSLLLQHRQQQVCLAPITRTTPRQARASLDSPQTRSSLQQQRAAACSAPRQRPPSPRRLAARREVACSEQRAARRRVEACLVMRMRQPTTHPSLACLVTQLPNNPSRLRQREGGSLETRQLRNLSSRRQVEDSSETLQRLNRNNKLQVADSSATRHSKLRVQVVAGSLAIQHSKRQQAAAFSAVRHNKTQVQVAVDSLVIRRSKQQLVVVAFSATAYRSRNNKPNNSRSPHSCKRMLISLMSS